MKCFVFPGQGAQRTGMGAELFGAFPDLMKRADDILGWSIEELCVGDDEKLSETIYTQPALYTVNALYWYAAKETPDYCAGHSLGEYNALLAAGVFGFEDGLRLVKKRGELMAASKNGGMAAVGGIGAAVVENVIRESNPGLCVSNINEPLQTVVSGKTADIEAAEAAFTDAGALMYKRLRVSGAFHSPLMEPAAKEFAVYARQFTFSRPRIPVIANVTAAPLEGDIAAYLSRQIISCVHWYETISFILDRGVGEITALGPGRAQKGIISRIMASRG